MIYDICQKNPRRIKTLKFDEEDYLINGIIWGPIINDLSDLIVGITFLAMGSIDGPSHEHIDMCLHDIAIPNAGDQDIQGMAGVLIVQRYPLVYRFLEELKLSIKFSTLGMIISVVTNYLVIYIRRRRIIIDYPNVKFYIVVLMYFNAMDWVSVGWLVNLSGAKPLVRCHEFEIDKWLINGIRVSDSEIVEVRTYNLEVKRPLSKSSY